MNEWAALCKALPGTASGLSLWTKCSEDFETVKQRPTNMPFVKLVNPVKWDEVVAVDVETTSPMFALALGCGKRDKMETIYQNMLEFARHRGTCTAVLTHTCTYTACILHVQRSSHIHTCTLHYTEVQRSSHIHVHTLHVYYWVQCSINMHLPEHARVC